MTKKILIFLLVALVIIQFFHPKRNKAEGIQPEYVGNIYPIPENVKSILARACNDCHSNNSRYPWYSNFQPVGWWLASHINEGKRKLNLDVYSKKSLRYQYHKMEEIEELVSDGGMPLKSYLWVHKDAKLTSLEKNKLIAWTKDVRHSMETKYLLDSLIKKN